MSATGQQLRDVIARHRAGDHAAAEAGYREYLKEYPDDPSGLHFLGLLRTHQGRNEEAVKLMIAALEIDPEYVDAWSNLGVAYFKERDFDRAELCARKAIAISPDFANAWANLGMTLRAKNAYEEARRRGTQKTVLERKAPPDLFHASSIGLYSEEDGARFEISR